MLRSLLEKLQTSRQAAHPSPRISHQILDGRTLFKAMESHFDKYAEPMAMRNHADRMASSSIETLEARRWSVLVSDTGDKTL